MKVQHIIEKNIEHMEWKEDRHFQFKPGAAIFVNALITGIIPEGYSLSTPQFGKIKAPLRSNQSYVFTHLKNTLDASALVLKCDDGSHVCLSLEEFLNAFSDNELPAETNCVSVFESLSVTN
tara:strand:+ start:2622 stop:2987 length:366 start_codon:yes stop_codon:yes gene_type:complete